MVIDQQEFQDYFKLWDLEAEEHSPDWPQYRSSEAIRLVKELAAKRGLPSISTFIIAFSEAKASGAIKPVRAPKPIEKEFTLSAAEYNKLPATVVIRRFRAEPQFREAVQALIAAGQI